MSKSEIKIGGATAVVERGVLCIGDDSGVGMTVTRSAAARLALIFHRFAETGEIGEPARAPQDERWAMAKPDPRSTVGGPLTFSTAYDARKAASLIDDAVVVVRIAE